MKKTKKTNSSKVMLFAGAAALMALTPQIQAQSSVDALLNKLEQKGVLTVDEAKELKAENTQDSADDFHKALNARFPIPDWVTGYKLSGDFRGRFDDMTGDNPDFVSRIRLRYRLRVGMQVNMQDNLQAGFRLGSGDYPGTQGGSPNSNNSTLQDNFSKKSVYIDAAYGKWTAINDDTWMVAATIGKTDNPFQLTPMVFDPDLTPEGATLQTSYKINDHHSLALTGAAFVLDEEKLSTQDPFMYGAQFIWGAKWTPKLSSSLGVAAFDIVNRDQLTTANVQYINQGNTRVVTLLNGNILANNYNPIIADGSVTYTLDTFPLYKGRFPIKIAGEFIDNPGASANNNGYWGGLVLGQAGKKGAWDISYRYEYLEADAWYDQLVDDDNAVFYANTVTGGPAYGAGPVPPGVYGSTNIKGHLIKFNYSLTDALTFSFTCYINDLINPGLNTVGNTFGTGQPQNHLVHLMADMMWKF
jgi:hypothetical protein